MSKETTKNHQCRITPEFECQDNVNCDFRTEHPENDEWCGENYEGYCTNREVQKIAVVEFMKVNIESAKRNGIDL